MVRSTVNYLGQMDELPVFYAQHHERDNLVLESHAVEIHDARKLDVPPSLETKGFTLLAHRSRVGNFADSDQIATIYRPEIVGLLTDLTGAARVIVGNVVLRWSEKAGPKDRFVNSDPARFVHVDYSRQSFDDFARIHLGDSADAEEWLARRYVAYNVWRVTTPPPQDVPLAVCDAGTTSPEDVTTGEAIIDAPGAPEVRFGSSLYHANRAHRWYWYPDMTPEEALVFKAFDSEQTRLQGCPHSAFDNPDCPAGVLPRASAEIRAYAFFQ